MSLSKFESTTLGGGVHGSRRREWCVYQAGSKLSPLVNQGLLMHDLNI